jgi:hypothetical protein
MNKNTILIFSLLFFYNFSVAQFLKYQNTDPRFIENGFEVPSHTYADQPYVIVCDDGTWLCTMTTSSGVEHAYMNNIIATRSYDNGKTWTDPINVEKPGVPQSSWAVPLKVPGGRIYVFYNYNKFGFTGLEGVMSGPFAFKYSDDNGKTWSEKRYEVPIRITQIDRENYTNGKHLFFWSIDKPVVTDDAAYIAFTKILRKEPNQPEFFKRSEGFILKSKNILYEKDPAKLNWETLPEGESGIWNPEFGKVQSEHNMVVLENGSLYVVYRTVDGSPVYAISSDGGKNFSTPQYMKYQNGEPIGNPRACPKIHKTVDGKYLFWFHNNFRQNTYNGRNPAWLSGGIEINGDIVWSQPELVLYDNDPSAFGMSYPDYIEKDGRLWIIETQKTTARVHEIKRNLIEGMWRQGKDTFLIEDGLIMNSTFKYPFPGMINFPQLPSLIDGEGFSIELWLVVSDFIPEQTVLSTIGKKNKGIRISLLDNNSVKLEINDGEMRSVDIIEQRSVKSDQNTINEGQIHHVVFTIDGAAQISTVIVDGILSDGSVSTREYGWNRLHPYLKGLNDTHICTFNEKFNGSIYYMSVYNRPLRASEALANFHAGLKKYKITKE